LQRPADYIQQRCAVNRFTKVSYRIQPQCMPPGLPIIMRCHNDDWQFADTFIDFRLQFIRNFLANWTETQWDILNIAEVGDVVFCERLDRTKTTQGNVDLPCAGIFEMENGKIKEWRDYFDLGTFMNAMS